MNDRNASWMYDESIPPGVDYTASGVVDDYDQEHGRFRDFDEEAGRIVEALGLDETSSILEFGCGTGELTLRFAEACRCVRAVDVSQQMIDKVRSKAAERRLENVSTVRSGFLSYEHDDAPVDAIVSSIALHHLPDFWKQVALCRLYEMLKPAGMLFLGDVVFDFPPSDYSKEIESWLAGMERVAGPGMAEESAIHVREEFSTWDWVMSGMIERAGFVVESKAQVMPHFFVYICSR